MTHKQDDNLAKDLLWGVKAIAAALGTTPRKCYWMLEKDLIPAKQVGRTWVASRAALSAFFRDDEKQTEAA